MRIETLIDVFDKLPYKAKELIISKESLDLIEDVSLMLQYIKSPMETILYVALTKKLNELDYIMYINPQTEIECKNGKKYIADFTIEYDDLVNKDFKEDFLLDIECDGYEFHQKTKEQVKKDNIREYDLKLEGYDVLRFSGTQIYENSEKCADEILKYIFKKNNIEIERCKNE